MLINKIVAKFMSQGKARSRGVRLFYAVEIRIDMEAPSLQAKGITASFGHYGDTFDGLLEHQRMKQDREAAEKKSANDQ